MSDLDDQHEDLRKPRGNCSGGSSMVFADLVMRRDIHRALHIRVFA